MRLGVITNERKRLEPLLQSGWRLPRSQPPDGSTHRHPLGATGKEPTRHSAFDPPNRAEVGEAGFRPRQPAALLSSARMGKVQSQARQRCPPPPGGSSGPAGPPLPGTSRYRRREAEPPPTRCARAGSCWGNARYRSATARTGGRTGPEKAARPEAAC